MVPAICVVLFAGATLIGTGAMAALQSGLDYEQFMQLNVEERLERLRSLAPESKAALRQTHAQRWLEANRPSLTQSQIELVLEGISILSADRDREPRVNEARKLERRLTCELGRARVTAAFTFLDPPLQRSWIDSVDEWLAWFPDCVLRW